MLPRPINESLNSSVKVTTLDEVLLHHGEFLDLCIKECLLNNPYLLKVSMAVCPCFSNHHDRRSDHQQAAVALHHFCKLYAGAYVHDEIFLYD